jgi:hypothetical protein
VLELKGVEASAEIQLAARKVADENRKLRRLLNDNGFTDDFLDSYLVSAAVAPPTDPNLPPQYRSGSTSQSVQSLETLLAPRRLSALEPNPPYSPVTGRSSRATSVASQSTAHSLWDQVPPSANAFRHPSISTTSHPAMDKISSTQAFSSSASTGVGLSRTETAYAPQGLGSLQDSSRLHQLSSQSTAVAGGAHSSGQSMNYDVSLHHSYDSLPRQLPTTSDYPTSTTAPSPVTQSGFGVPQIPTTYVSSSTMPPARTDNIYRLVPEIMSTITGVDRDTSQQGSCGGLWDMGDVDVTTLHKPLDRSSILVAMGQRSRPIRM